jgi:methyl-accepting chemotaxis protein/sigma-B regulation protein RsbU (phosphoserine phosphatase)
LFLLCQVITHRQLLPLRLLTRSAQRIAQGYYDEPIPSSSQDDEVGRLQDHFQQMQLSLAVKVGELEELTASLQERSKVLSKAYEQAQEANRVKTVFLHRMTNQMIEPVNDISNCVKTLHESGQQLEQEKVNQLVSDILEQGATTATLLKKLLDDSETNINP